MTNSQTTVLSWTRNFAVFGFFLSTTLCKGTRSGWMLYEGEMDPHFAFALFWKISYSGKFSRVQLFAKIQFSSGLNFCGFNFHVLPSSTVRYFITPPTAIGMTRLSLGIKFHMYIWRTQWPIEHHFQLRWWWEVTMPTRISGPPLMPKSCPAEGKMATGSTLSLYGHRTNWTRQCSRRSRKDIFRCRKVMEESHRRNMFLHTCPNFSEFKVHTLKSSRFLFRVFLIGTKNEKICTTRKFPAIRYVPGWILEISGHHCLW